MNKSHQPNHAFRVSVLDDPTCSVEMTRTGSAFVTLTLCDETIAEPAFLAFEFEARYLFGLARACTATAIGENMAAIFQTGKKVRITFQRADFPFATIWDFDAEAFNDALDATVHAPITYRHGGSK